MSPGLFFGYAGGQDHFTQASFGECHCPQKDIWVNGTTDPALQGEYNAVRFTQARGEGCDLRV